jgi:hypothetical protein
VGFPQEDRNKDAWQLNIRRLGCFEESAAFVAAIFAANALETLAYNDRCHDHCSQNSAATCRPSGAQLGRNHGYRSGRQVMRIGDLTDFLLECGGRRKHARHELPES